MSPSKTAYNDFTGTSEGAIFHTGSMRVFNSSFVANEVGVEGPAIMSIGFLEELAYVSFSANTYQCRVGEYGYIDKSEARKLSIISQHVSYSTFARNVECYMI